MNNEYNKGCTAAGCLTAIFWMSVIVIVATVLGACTAPPLPQPTPEIRYETLPAPTPLVIPLPGETFEVVPLACIAALDGADAVQDHTMAVMEAIDADDITAFNALMESMDGIYMEYWTQADACRRAAGLLPST